METAKPKVLIVCDATWADDNNIGATFSNLFRGYPKENIAMVYARPDLPNTVVCDNFFQISENRLIKSIFKKETISGIRVSNKVQEELLKEEKIGKDMYRFFRKFRFHSLLSAREILWKIGNWKTDELKTFIDDFNPDIIFSLACASIYMTDIQKFIVEYSNAKSVIYFVDDVYSAKQLSFSPFFWINKFFIRNGIKKIVDVSEKVYTIIEKQKKEYDNYLNVDSSILNKGGKTDHNLVNERILAVPLSLMYTGNIYAGRWNTLIELGKVIDRINEGQQKIQLTIYSKNELTASMKKDLSKIKGIYFKGAIPADKVSLVQSEADLLLHVESTSLRDKLLTRLSFSTKLVDYFFKGKCILAIGWKNSASISYLKENDIAIIIDDMSNAYSTLLDIFENKEKIGYYGMKSREFGMKNHNIDKIQERLIKDLVDISILKK